jgi:hypothetical protein
VLVRLSVPPERPDFDRPRLCDGVRGGDLEGLLQAAALADSSLSDFDEAAAALLKERTLTFLERVG